MMNRMKIEAYAVHAVADRINLVDNFASFITENDKTPSWDGDIYIYNNKDLKKAGVERLSTQVKGTEQKDFSKPSVKKGIDIEDLRNFKRDGGCLYFIVYIKKEELEDGLHIKKKVYYKELTPVMIEKIQKGMKPNGKKPGIEFKELPNDPETISRIINACKTACNMQSSFAGQPFPSLDDMIQKYPSGKIKIIGARDTTFPTAIFDDEAYIYFEVPGLEALVPLCDETSSLIIDQEISKSVFVGGVEYYPSYSIFCDSKNTMTYRIGNSLSLTIRRNQKIEFTYTFPTMLNQYVKDQAFMLACFENQGFEIDGKHYIMKPPEKKIEEFGLKQQKAQFAFYEKAYRVFGMLHCRDDLDLSSLDKNDRRNIRLLISCLLEGEVLTNSENKIPRYLSFDIGPLFFAFVTEKEEKGFRIKDYFYSEESIHVTGMDGNQFEAPHFYTLRNEDFLRISNIQFDVFLPAFTKYEMSSDLLAITNLFLLELIKAYDKAEGWRKDVIYDTAVAFSNWLLKAPDELFSQNIGIINNLQLIKRKRKFNEEEKGTLYEIIRDENDNDGILAAVYILLEVENKARDHFDKLSEDEKAEFMTFPIYSLFKEDSGNHNEHSDE